jgi:hypothetical protein
MQAAGTDAHCMLGYRALKYTDWPHGLYKNKQIKTIIYMLKKHDSATGETR